MGRALGLRPVGEPACRTGKIAPNRGQLKADSASRDAVVLPLEGDAVVDGDEAAVGDGDAMGVTRHIAQHLLGATERLLGLDDPIGVAQGRQIGGERVGGW